MINYLVGRLESKKAPFVVLEVNGVGYEVQVSLNALESMPDAGCDVKLLTYLIVREDAHLLYGFADLHERELFKSLIKKKPHRNRLDRSDIRGLQLVPPHVEPRANSLPRVTKHGNNNESCFTKENSRSVSLVQFRY